MKGQHVPAWKKLGLKLKNANDIRAESTIGSKNHSNDDNQETTVVSYSSRGLQEAERPLKRARIEDAVDNSELVTSKASDNGRRRKSVTFAPDTKVKDGSPLELGNGSHVSRDATLGLHIMHDEKDNLTPELPPAKKKKRNQKAVSATSQNSRKLSAALQYLHEFHHNHASWKFNKNYDSWILKNVMSEEKISAKENFALASYLHGLKSDGARKRLIEESRKAFDERAMEFDSNAMLQERLRHILEVSAGESDVESEQSSEFENLERPVLILVALNEKIVKSSASFMQNGDKRKRVKKNKSRTSRIEVESSSSSEDDSENESAKELRPAQRNSINLVTSNGAKVQVNRDARQLASSGSSTDTSSEESSETSSSGTDDPDSEIEDS